MRRRFDSAKRGQRAHSASWLKPPGRRASSPFDGFAQADPAAPHARSVPPHRRTSRVTTRQRPRLWTSAFAGVRSVPDMPCPTPSFLQRRVLHMFRAEVPHGA